MKPIIGIVFRYGKSENTESLYCYKQIIDKIIKSNGIPIGINLSEKCKEQLNIINGIILQGGDDYSQEEIEIVKYAHNNDIPILGICQGMQIMGIAACGELVEIKNHMKKNIDKAHIININKNSKIYEIIKKQVIIVNSRHNYAIKNTTLQISSSKDNIIESIEDKNKKFFIGVQWHPESLNNNDSKKLFDYFIKKASVKK